MLYGYNIMHYFILAIFLFYSELAFTQFKVKIITTKLDKPIFLTNYPGSRTRLLAVEQNGIIRIIENNIILDTPFLDISKRTHTPLFPADEMGMLGLAFHPDFKNNGFFYVNYINNDDFTIVSRFKINNNIADHNSENILIKLKQPYMNHNGGSIEFGHDGYLYISIGDGGSAGDPQNRAQDLSNLFGSILRIDIDNGTPYSIPTNNPFNNINNARGEIWNYGLRNVWRFSFDRKTGDLYLGDVGQSAWEEINFQSYNSKGGINYGWNILEGTDCYPDNKQNCQKINLRDPIFKYPNNANSFKTLLGINQPNAEGCSITGGYVYRGNNITELYGRYIFGDYCTGKIWSININENNLDLKDHTGQIMAQLNKKEFYLSSFGEDEYGELYLINYSGEIYSITK